MTTPPEPPSEWFCSHCGHAADPAEPFCAHCGASVTTPTAGQPSTPPVAPQAPPPTTPPVPPAGSVYETAPIPAAPIAPPPGSAPAPGAAPAPAPTSWVRNNKVAVALGALGLILVAAIAFVLVTRDSGGSGDATPEFEPPPTVPTATTVLAGALAPSSPVEVVVTDEDRDVPRVHPISMSAGDTGTILVRSGQRFTPSVVLVDPDGTVVPTEGTALHRRGGAVNVTAPAAGELSVLVSGFSAGQSGYSMEFRPGVSFVGPEAVTLGDCVDLLEGETWRTASGLFVVGCDQPHDGQVFEQLAGDTASGDAAQQRCFTARRDRVGVPGRVGWWAYWGGDVTCVVRGQGGGRLTGSIVAT